MTPERYSRIGQIFDEALDLPSEQRQAYLKQACSGDASLMDEVERLLANHSDAATFLSRPAMELAAQMLAQNHVPFAPGKQISHYKVLAPLGAGGMGEVFLAEDTRLKRKVALKLLPETVAQDKEHLQRFEHEAFAASALNHPNILTIYEFAAEGETLFLATEFIDGETVRSYLKREPLPLTKALDIAIQSAQALTAAHQAGIVHRDIKPDNVMIRKDGIIKVLDFGLAKLIEDAALDTEAETRVQTLTKAGTVLGTAAYMSPEQARGKIVDTRSDIFSLGVVLYEMVTRYHPFMGETVSHTLVAILEKEPPPLSHIVKDVPAELQQIINRSLAKKAEDRYSSAAALLADLRQLQKHLDFDSEVARTSPSRYNSDADSQTLRPGSREHVGETAGIPKRELTVSRKRTGVFWLLGGLAAAIIIGIATWQWLRPKPAAAPVRATTQVTPALPERSLSYSLTVQKYHNGKPYETEFQTTGREIFEPGWKFKLNMTSPQEGYLYLLDLEPSGNYRLLFPSSLNNGLSYLKANGSLQTNWYYLDKELGIEHIKLVWAAQPVPELERLRGSLNNINKGVSSDPDHIRAVTEFIQQHPASQVEMNEDRENKQTSVRGRGDLLVAPINLEHH